MKMVSLKISLEVEQKFDINKLFSNNNIPKNLNDQIHTEIIPDNGSLSFDGNQLVEIIVNFSIGVASGVVGNYIYNAIHNASKKIEINGKRTRLTEESITEAIETIKQLVNENSTENNN